MGISWSDRKLKNGKRLDRGFTTLDDELTGGRLQKIQSPPNPGPQNNQEVRINEYAYDTIIANGLYSQEGILEKVDYARTHGRSSFVEFNSHAKEVKAAWVRLWECDTNISRS